MPPTFSSAEEAELYRIAEALGRIAVSLEAIARCVADDARGGRAIRIQPAPPDDLAAWRRINDR